MWFMIINQIRKCFTQIYILSENWNSEKTTKATSMQSQWIYRNRHMISIWNDYVIYWLLLDLNIITITQESVDGSISTFHLLASKCFCHLSYISSNKLRSFVHAPIKEMKTHTTNNQIKYKFWMQIKWKYQFYFMFHIYYWIIIYLVNLLKTLKTGSRKQSGFSSKSSDKLLPNFSFIYVKNCFIVYESCLFYSLCLLFVYRFWLRTNFTSLVRCVCVCFVEMRAERRDFCEYWVTNVTGKTRTPIKFYWISDL